ncbi:MAG: carboxypeptidase-like regulatory domain-containing protein [Paludibacter sp.]
MTNLLLLLTSDKDFYSPNSRKLGLTFLATFLLVLSSFAQQIEIKGKILDENSNVSVIGVTIKVKKQQGGAVTNVNGDFRLNVKSLFV